MTIRPASDRAFYLVFGEEISFEMHQAVARATRALEGVRGLRNLHPGYASLLVDFDPRLLTFAQAAALAEDVLERRGGEPAPAPRHLDIPVVYGGEHGPARPPFWMLRFR